MLVPLIFQRAPYLTAALLTRSQPCLFSCWGWRFPTAPAQGVGIGQGWVPPRVSLSVTCVPASDAHSAVLVLQELGVTLAQVPGSGWRWGRRFLTDPARCGHWAGLGDTMCPQSWGYLDIPTGVLLMRSLHLPQPQLLSQPGVSHCPGHRECP